MNKIMLKSVFAGFKKVLSILILAVIAVQAGYAVVWLATNLLDKDFLDAYAIILRVIFFGVGIYASVFEIIAVFSLGKTSTGIGRKDYKCSDVAFCAALYTVTFPTVLQLAFEDTALSYGGILLFAFAAVFGVIWTKINFIRKMLVAAAGVLLILTSFDGVFTKHTIIDGLSERFVYPYMDEDRDIYLWSLTESGKEIPRAFSEQYITYKKEFHDKFLPRLREELGEKGSRELLLNMIKTSLSARKTMNVEYFVQDMLRWVFAPIALWINHTGEEPSFDKWNYYKFSMEEPSISAAYMSSSLRNFGLISILSLIYLPMVLKKKKKAAAAAGVLFLISGTAVTLLSAHMADYRLLTPAIIVWVLWLAICS